MQGAEGRLGERGEGGGMYNDVALPVRVDEGFGSGVGIADML